jgi:acyl-CoA thioesterase FadM
VNVLLRFLFVIFTSPFKSRIGILDESVLSLRVWPNDIDLNFHMNNGRYLSLMDLGRMDLLGRLGFLGEGFRRQWFPMIGEARIRFRRQLRTFERFTLRTRILCWDEKWFYIEHIIEKVGGEVASVCYLRSLLRGRDGNIPPRTVLNTLGGYDIESPPIPEVILKWIEAERA